MKTQNLLLATCALGLTFGSTTFANSNQALLQAPSANSIMPRPQPGWSSHGVHSAMMIPQASRNIRTGTTGTKLRERRRNRNRNVAKIYQRRGIGSRLLPKRKPETNNGTSSMTDQFLFRHNNTLKNIVQTGHAEMASPTRY